MTVDPIIRMPELTRLTGLSKATIYRMVAEGTFPRPVQLSKQAVGWRASAIQRWNEGLEEVPLGAAPWAGLIEQTPKERTSGTERRTAGGRR